MPCPLAPSAGALIDSIYLLVSCHGQKAAVSHQQMCTQSMMHCGGSVVEQMRFVRVQEEEVPLMVRSSSGLHSHSLRLAKQDSITSLQTKLRQQFRQSAHLLAPSTAASCFACCFCPSASVQDGTRRPRPCCFLLQSKPCILHRPVHLCSCL